MSNASRRTCSGSFKVTINMVEDVDYPYEHSDDTSLTTKIKSSIITDNNKTYLYLISGPKRWDLGEHYGLHNARTTTLCRILHKFSFRLDFHLPKLFSWVASYLYRRFEDRKDRLSPVCIHISTLLLYKNYPENLFSQEIFYPVAWCIYFLYILYFVCYGCICWNRWK